MNIDDIRKKCKLKFSDGKLTKDELKFLFMDNYRHNHKIYRLPALNNNLGNQCFRNASFIFLSRMQYVIYGMLCILNDDLTKNEDFNKYLIIQTLIELMDNIIIENLINSNSAIAQKRTTFLDNRLDEYRFNEGYPDNIGALYVTKQLEGLQPTLDLSNIQKMIEYKIKYLKNGIFGLLQYRKARDEYQHILFGTVVDSVSGGNSYDVIDYLINNVFHKESIFISTDRTAQEEPHKIYTIYNTNMKGVQIKGDIERYKIKTNTTTKDKYKLVGILYNCERHEFASICFGDNCETRMHTFINDATVSFKEITEKVGCSSNINTTVSLLYENEIVQDHMNQEFLKNPLFEGLRKEVDLVPPYIHGGNINYYDKYKKYKTKYITLKNNKMC